MRWLTLGLVLAASAAHADVIDEDWEPPECDDVPCPPGSMAVAMGHSSCPSVCAPNMECESHDACTERYGEGAQCIPTRFCVGTAYGGNSMSPEVLDNCEPAGPCGTGAPDLPEGQPAPECSEVRRCQPPAPPPASSTPARGGCAGCSTGGGGGGVFVFVVALLALWRRRVLAF